MEEENEGETQVEAENVAEEVETEIVAEEIEEIYIPEGIDMESTLPGQEWLDTFVGEVNEPVVVVFNDNTGRKEVVQTNSEIVINPDEDVFAIYMNVSNMG